MRHLGIVKNVVSPVTRETNALAYKFITQHQQLKLQLISFTTHHLFRKGKTNSRFKLKVRRALRCVRRGMRASFSPCRFIFVLTINFTA